MPFQKKCASSGSSSEPSIEPLQLVLQADLLVGNRPDRSSGSHREPTQRAGHRRNGRDKRSARYVRYPPNNSSAPSPLSATVVCVLHHLRQKPDRQRARIRARLVRVVREVLDRALQIHVRVQIELMMVGAVAARPSRGSTRVSSKLRPWNETENVFSRAGDACAA